VNKLLLYYNFMNFQIKQTKLRFKSDKTNLVWFASRSSKFVNLLNNILSAQEMFKVVKNLIVNLTYTTKENLS